MLSFSVSRRRAIATARTSSRRSGALSAWSPQSMANWASRPICGELGVPQQMRQAHLPISTISALAAIRVRYPDPGPHRAKHLARHVRATRGPDPVQHAMIDRKNLLPPRAPAYPCGRLIRAYHPACHHRPMDRGGRCGQGRAAACQDVAERPFADTQAKYLGHDGPKPFQPDRVAGVQIDHQGVLRCGKRALIQWWCNQRVSCR